MQPLKKPMELLDAGRCAAFSGKRGGQRLGTVGVPQRVQVVCDTQRRGRGLGDQSDALRPGRRTAGSPRLRTTLNSVGDGFHGGISMTKPERSCEAVSTQPKPSSHAPASMVWSATGHRSPVLREGPLAAIRPRRAALGQRRRRRGASWRIKSNGNATDATAAIWTCAGASYVTGGETRCGGDGATGGTPTKEGVSAG